MAFFNFASVADAEKCPLGYQMPLSVHRPRYCGVQTLLLKMHCGSNRGRNGRILTSNELNLTFRVPKYGAKFHQNRLRIATVGGWTDSHDRRE